MNTTNTQDPARAALESLSNIADWLEENAPMQQNHPEEPPDFATEFDARLNQAAHGIREAIVSLQSQAPQPPGDALEAYRPDEASVRKACEILTRIRDAADHWEGGWSGTKSNAEHAINLLRYGSRYDKDEGQAAEGFQDGVASVQPPGDAREAFEAWVKKETPELDLRPHRDGGYLWATTQTLWAAWQAARHQGFDAHDMATAAADGFRDGVASTQASEPSDWRGHVEQRIRTWRQSQMNRNGDRLAIDDFMDQQSLDDLVDFVCDVWAEPATPAQASEPSAAPAKVTDEMVTAYLQANDAYWLEADKLPRPLTAWRNGTAREATRESLAAALATAAPARAVEPLTEAIAAEREACAQLVESTKEWRGKGWVSTLSPETQAAIVAAIRSRAHGITTTPAAKAGKDGA